MSAGVLTCTSSVALGVAGGSRRVRGGADRRRGGRDYSQPSRRVRCRLRWRPSPRCAGSTALYVPLHYASALHSTCQRAGRGRESHVNMQGEGEMGGGVGAGCVLGGRRRGGRRGADRDRKGMHYFCACSGSCIHVECQTLPCFGVHSVIRS